MRWFGYALIVLIVFATPITVAAFNGSRVITAAEPDMPKGSSTSSDLSDIWWNPAESGWGVQFIQSKNVIFATLFVYNQSGQPTWYAATMTQSAGLVWSGALYSSSGPYFGAPFNPSAVAGRQVGTMTANIPFV